MPYKDKEKGHAKRREWSQNNPVREMLKTAQRRTKAKIKKNPELSEVLKCSIMAEDITMPTHCPILLMKLKWCDGKMADNSATLDRVNNNKWYVIGNVKVVSNLANKMKANSTFKIRALFVNWVLKTLLEHQKHLKWLDLEVLEKCLHLARKNAAASKMALAV